MISNGQGIRRTNRLEIPTGAVVEIEEIRGVKLIVKEIIKEG